MLSAVRQIWETRAEGIVFVSAKTSHCGLEINKKQKNKEQNFFFILEKSMSTGVGLHLLLSLMGY